MRARAPPPPPHLQHGVREAALAHLKAHAVGEGERRRIAPPAVRQHLAARAPLVHHVQLPGLLRDLRGAEREARGA